MTLVLTREPLAAPREQREPEQPPTVTQALALLSIRPFRRETVEQYKATMVRRATPLMTRIGEPLLNMAKSLFFLGMAIWIGSFLTYVVLSFLTPVPLWFALTVLISFAVTILSLVGMYVLAGRKVTYATWESVPMDSYWGSIPRFVRQMVYTIRDWCPEAEFFIEELRFEERRIDPFLVVYDAHEGTPYYLEVWNEPDFDQQRQW